MNKSHLARILNKSRFFETVDNAGDLIQRCKDYLNLDISMSSAKELLATLKPVFEFVNTQATNPVIDQLQSELQQSKDKIATLESELQQSSELVTTLENQLATAKDKIATLESELQQSSELVTTQQSLDNTVKTKDKKILQPSLDMVNTVCNNDCNSNCNSGENMELSLEQRYEQQEQRLSELEKIVLPVKHKIKPVKPPHPLNGEQFHGWGVSWQGKGWSVNRRFGNKVISRFIGKEWNETKALERINEYLNKPK